jgi:hypothetical protein
MKRIYILFLAVVTFISGCTTLHAKYDITSPEVFDAEIRTKIESVKRNIQIEAQRYDDARIEYIYLEHKRKKKKKGEKDYLYVKGAVKNLMNRHLSGAIVTADFIDASGQVVAREYGEVIPRIIRLNGAKKGYFTVKTSYNPSVSLCKLTLNWNGKEEE